VRERAGAHISPALSLVLYTPRCVEGFFSELPLTAFWEVRKTAPGYSPSSGSREALEVRLLRLPPCG
jgi:hypothetical protein